MKHPNKEQYKELDELMTYILDEMWGKDDKQLIRDGLIAYANKWHEVQTDNINYRQDTLQLILSEMLKASRRDDITKGEFWKLPRMYAIKINALYTKLIDVMYEKGLNDAANDILSRI